MANALCLSKLVSVYILGRRPRAFFAFFFKVGPSGMMVACDRRCEGECDSQKLQVYSLKMAVVSRRSIILAFSGKISCEFFFVSSRVETMRMGW